MILDVQDGGYGEEEKKHHQQRMEVEPFTKLQKRQIELEK